MHPDEEESIPLPRYDKPPPHELSIRLASDAAPRPLSAYVPRIKSRPLVAAAILFTFLGYYSYITPFTTSSARRYQHGYTPQDTPPAYVPGARPLSNKDSSLPIYTLPNGTRYHRLTPSSHDPWAATNPRIASEWLSDYRFPPPADAVGVDANSKENQERREEVGWGTKPPPEAFEVPAEHLDAAYEFFAAIVAGWGERGLNAGEGYDEKGRPTMVPRENVYMGADEEWTPPKLGKTKDLPKVQHHSGGTDPRSKSEKLEDGRRREWVRKAFLHLWEGYKEHSWAHDELKPLSGGSSDAFNGWSATIVDTIDTLLIMGLTEEYELARDHIAQIDFSYLTPKNPASYSPPSIDTLPPLSFLRPTPIFVSLPPHLASPQAVPAFETVIRYLGALLSAYDLSHDPLMLRRARELGDWMLPSLGTWSGLGVGTYRIGMNPHGGPTGKAILAEVGSLSLEFTRLSQVTGDDAYFNAISRATDCLDSWKATDRVIGLLPIHLNPEDPRFLTGAYSFGGQADSYYEYLLKEHQLLRGAHPQYSRMYANAIDAAHKHLIRPIEVVPGIKGMVTIGDLHYKEEYQGQIVSWYSPRLDHLTCFAGGMLGLGSKLLSRSRDLVTATQFTKACTWAYEATRTGLAPEIMQLWSERDENRFEVITLADGSQVKSVKGDPMGFHSGSLYHIQRPETIESVLYMYRLTGDRSYQDQGWRMFTNWVAATIVGKGFAHVNDVNSPKPRHDDSGVESFVYSETLKYYYLLFSPPSLLSLDDWVFTTEAHPFRIPKPSAKDDPAPFWKGPELEMPEGPLGEGTDVQKWARVVQAAAANGWEA